MDRYYNRLKKLSFKKRVPEIESNNTDNLYETLDLFNRDYVFVKTISPLIPKNGNVLDLGCGSGNILFMLSQMRPDIRLTGIDASTSMLKLAQQKQSVLFQKNGIKWIKGKIEKKSMPTSTFDFIYCHFVAHHINNLYILFEKMIALLTDYGKFYIKDFLRPKNGIEAVLQVKNTSSCSLSKAQFKLHFDSLRASYTLNDVREITHCFNLKLVYTIKKSKFYWEVNGYKNDTSDINK